MDLQILFPIGFVLLGTLGLVCGALALWHYLWSAPSTEEPREPVAIAAFGVQYGLVLAIALSQRYLLLPTILSFLTAIALIVAIAVGLKAHSEAGFRVALAGLSTSAAYLCLLGAFLKIGQR